MKSRLYGVLLGMLIFVQTCSVNNNSLTNEPHRDEKSDAVMDICSLMEKPEQFDQSEVRVRAILITGREYSYLYEPACSQESRFVWYTIVDEKVNEKLGRYIDPENEEYKSVGLIRVRATFIGSFEVKRDSGFGHEGFFNYKLQIRDVDAIENVPAGVKYPWQ